MTTSTASISNSVKPALRSDVGGLLPARDILFLAFATFLLVGSE
jgi:hypothetical protein